MTDAEIIKSLKSEPIEDLRRLQKKPFAWKVDHAKDVIREFYERENGMVYVSFSGGKANDRSGTGRKRKSDFKKIEQSNRIAKDVA